MKLRVGIGTESYRLFTFGHGSSWFVENAETAVELSEGESAYRLDIGTITQRADGVWVLPVRLERRDSPREPVWEPPPQSAEARLA